MNTILENGEEVGVTPDQAKTLLSMEMIYKCDECNCYHVDVNTDIVTIKAFINLSK